LYGLSCSTITNVIGQCQNSNLELAHDIGEAANFATYFTGSPAAESTPHLYISALATWSQDTNLCQKWKEQFSHIPVFTHTKGNIARPLMTIRAGGGIYGVAFSGDGTRIVSGSSDQSVQVWDASTGAQVNELKGHTGHVWSVAFSSDGTHIVSGSDDNSVRVWDALTGAQLNKLNGHTGQVWSVAFSGDGTHIVSGSILYFLVPHRFRPESAGMGPESAGMRPELPESAGMRPEWLNSARMPPEFIREGLRQYQNHLIGHI
jgi:WD40 repeat protein